MAIISSDYKQRYQYSARIWLDFEAIGELEVPFLLPCTCAMATKAVSNAVEPVPFLRQFFVHYIA